MAVILDAEMGKTSMRSGMMGDIITNTYLRLSFWLWWCSASPEH